MKLGEKPMKKRLITIILSLVMVVNLMACGSEDSTKIQELEEKIEELKDEIEELEANIEELEEENEELRAQNKENEELPEEETSAFVPEMSGVCGANATWEYGSGVLKIHGTGEMTDYYNDRPWEDVKDKIQHIYIDEGITSIGEFAFYDIPLLSKIVIPSSVKEIMGSYFGCFEPMVEAAEPDEEISDEEIREFQKKYFLEFLNREFTEIKEISWGDKTYTSFAEFISEIYR